MHSGKSTNSVAKKSHSVTKKLFSPQIIVNGAISFRHFTSLLAVGVKETQQRSSEINRKSIQSQ